jgi:hypothetical protein
MNSVTNQSFSPRKFLKHIRSSYTMDDFVELPIPLVDFANQYSQKRDKMNFLYDKFQVLSLKLTN